MSCREKSTETGDLVRNPVKAIFPFKKPSSLSTSDSIMNAVPILTDTNQITAASSFQMDRLPFQIQNFTHLKRPRQPHESHSIIIIIKRAG